MSIEIRVYEGNTHPTVPEDLHAELSLPDTMGPSDRCDKCGAQALHAFALHNIGGGEPAVLRACNHHARTWHNNGMTYLAHRDYRTPLDQWHREQEAAKEASLKAIAAKKLDDSNFVAGTSLPLWRAQWDRDEWWKS